MADSIPHSRNGLHHYELYSKSPTRKQDFGIRILFRRMFYRLGLVEIKKLYYASQQVVVMEVAINFGPV